MKEESDNSNLSFHYVDEKTNIVIVGLIDNSEDKQEEFIYNVFSNCCGSTYTKYIKENKIIHIQILLIFHLDKIYKLMIKSRT